MESNVFRGCNDCALIDRRVRAGGVAVIFEQNCPHCGYKALIQSKPISPFPPTQGTARNRAIKAMKRPFLSFVAEIKEGGFLKARKPTPVEQLSYFIRSMINRLMDRHK